MTTIQTILLCFALVLTPLSGEVFAQFSETASTSESTNSVTAETTLTQEKWYRSEKVEGNIDIGDFVVGPGRAEITVSPGETLVQEITVTNRISAGRTFKLEVEDITGSVDGSSAVSLTGTERGPYSIRDYISFPTDTFVLDLGERARIPVTIKIPENAEPGGFYGSVLVSTDRTGTSDAGAPRSPIVARVGSLFFVTVRGDIEMSGETKDIKTLDGKVWYEEGPINLGITYENTGSVHVNPYGEVSISNMFGEEVGFVELEPWFVLPKSLRSREVTWDREFLFGRYKVTARINRGYENQIDEVNTVFWVLPWKIVLGIFVIVFTVVFVIRAFFRTFEFKRKS
ncbi:MAG: hypothetical protein KBC62_00915 [Candidatus Pacebacteria bacterium]|nr:hypothetical protein [Candidatus Paceibacterota bacterium]MBP9842543.1 hypothetical protein [Candidatus Paceibacterota bacterium]